jgi:SPP1 family predicted phage head-tail adaptor
MAAIGEMNKRVEFKNPTKVADGAGGYTESYSTLLSCWAHVKEKGGSRYLMDGQSGMEDRKTVYVYFQDNLWDNLTPETYVVYDSKEFSIDFYSLLNETKKIIRFDVSAA